MGQLIEAIDTIKILDPACGSGAFPMGILHKLVYILGKLDPGNERWKAKQIAKANEIPDSTIREKVIDDIEQAFERNELDYGRKLYLIENCIYGVDIQPIAVQIAKLRFFISLVVDQKIDDTQENRGIIPLPNLETKFVAANTLIGIDKPAQLTLRNPAIDQKEEELADVRRRHFTARTQRTKDKYRELDSKLRAEISDLLKKDGFPSETTEKLAFWDPYNQNASADFFDPEWMFGVTDGFDVVIGNPPYGIIFDTAQKLKYNLLYPTFVRNNDIYVAFYERGTKLLNARGQLAYISPNTFLNGDYFKALRKFLTKETIIKEILDYKEALVFDDPTVFVCVFICSRASKITYPYQALINIANGSISNLAKGRFTIRTCSDAEFKPSNSILEKLFDDKRFCMLDNLFFVKDVGFNYWTRGKGKKRDGNSIGDRVFYSGERRHLKDIPFLKHCLENAIQLNLDEVKAMLYIDNTEIRTYALAYLTNILSETELEQLPAEYSSAGGYYYYVITWLDRWLYTPKKLRESFREELNARIFSA